MIFDHTTDTRRRSMKGLLRRFLVRRDGATAIEFALLSLPFFLIVIASIETFIAFSAEQLLANATETMARKIRTGEITFNLGKINTDKTPVQFRKLFCDEIALLMPCSANELKTPDKLYLDVRTFAKFTDIPKTIPHSGTDLNINDFKFAPGGSKSINIVRAYYRWDIVTDLVRPFLSNIKSADGSRQNYLMVANVVIQNEAY